MGQRLTVVEHKSARLVEVLVGVGRNYFFTKQSHETSSLEADSGTNRQRVGQVVLSRIDPAAGAGVGRRVGEMAGAVDRLRDLAHVDVRHEAYGAVFLDVQISLGQLETVLIPSAQG